MRSGCKHLGTLAVALLLGAGGGYAQEVILSPQLHQIEMPAGGTSEFEITIGNPSETLPISLYVRTAAVAQNQRGDYKVAETENQWSCSAWIEVDEKQITIAPGEAQVVRCKIKAPYVARGSRYAAVVFSFKERTGTGAVTADLTYVLASFVEVSMTGGSTVPKAEISGLTVKPVFGNRQLEAAYGRDAFFILADVKNTGIVGVTATAVLRIKDEKGLHSREVPLGEGRGVVIPGATVSYRSLFPNRPPPGNYIAEASLDYGGIRPGVAKCTFSVDQTGRVSLGALESVATVGLGVMPRTMDVRAARRSTRVLSVTLNNVEDHPIKISADLLPLTQSADGRFGVQAGAQSTQRDYSWIAVDPQVLEVPARSKKRVKVTLEVPEDAGPSEYVRIALTPELPELSMGMLQESYSTDLFITVPPDLTEKLDVKSVSVARVRRFSPTEIAFEIENLGNCHVDIDAQVSIKGSTGKTVKELRLTDRNTRILPGVTRKFTIPDPQGLEAGAYTCEVNVSLGGKAAGYKSANFSISG